MTQWGKICRICASPADYEIFANIPIYLHANCKDFLIWQKPINEMLEETTGMKVSPDDGLPKNICALCISYLKHAITFREQAINTCLNFLAVKEYKRIINDKEVWNFDEIKNDIKQQQPYFDDEDDNLLTNNHSKNQNKVKKQLIYNTNESKSTLSRQTQLCLQYLIKLYDNNTQTATAQTSLPSSNKGGGGVTTTGTGYNKSMSSKSSRRQYNKTNEMMPGCSGGSAGGGGSAANMKRQNLEDDLPRTTSSDEYEEADDVAGVAGHAKNNNIFSYKEKNFEEDDIMDLDELKDAITINIPSTCKEHKCLFCFKRFMFEESFGEHIKTCIEYKFATFLEEMNNLLYIRRAKEISPHEFIRRMIFSLRKTCEWLKENCIDTTLPDLLQNNQAAAAKENNKPRLESESKSTTSSMEEAQKNTDKKTTNKTRISSYSSSSPILLARRPMGVCNTPINMSNNILHEIERSESRNSNKLKKPIAILATSSSSALNNLSTPPTKSLLSEDIERLAFMQKLQNAHTPKTTKTPPNKPTNILKFNNDPPPPTTPLIAVRQDLLATITNTTLPNTSPFMDLLHSSSSQASITPVVNMAACARCPQCNLFFDTLDSLEIHNALQHNSMRTTSSGTSSTLNTKEDLDEEHKRIIALFEDEDEF